jgi:hypothetical protein
MVAPTRTGITTPPPNPKTQDPKSGRGSTGQGAAAALSKKVPSPPSKKPTPSTPPASSEPRTNEKPKEDKNPAEKSKPAESVVAIAKDGKKPEPALKPLPNSAAPALPSTETLKTKNNPQDNQKLRPAGPVVATTTVSEKPESVSAPRANPVASASPPPAPRKTDIPQANQTNQPGERINSGESAVTATKVEGVQPESVTKPLSNPAASKSPLTLKELPQKALDGAVNLTSQLAGGAANAQDAPDLWGSSTSTFPPAQAQNSTAPGGGTQPPKPLKNNTGLKPKQENWFGNFINSAKELAINTVTDGLNIKNGVTKRQDIPSLENAIYEKTPKGTTFELNNGITVPPISREGFNNAINNARLSENDKKALLSKPGLYEDLKQNPHLPIIASELQNESNNYTDKNNNFQSDKYFRENTLPKFIEGTKKSGGNIDGAISMLRYAVSTLRDPLMRESMENNINAGKVGSFSSQETSLSNKQFVFNMALGTPADTKAKETILKKETGEKINVDKYVGPDVIGRAFQPAIGVEETPMAHAVAIQSIKDRSDFTPEMIKATEEANKHLVRLDGNKRDLAKSINSVSQNHSERVLSSLTSEKDWNAIGLDKSNLNETPINQLNDTTQLGNRAIQYQKFLQKTGKQLDINQSYSQSLEDTKNFFLRNPLNLSKEELSRRLLKDQVLNNPNFLKHLESKNPELRNEISNISEKINKINDEYKTGRDVNKTVHNQLLKDGLDISSNSLGKLTPGFSTHLENVVDNTFLPRDPAYQSYKDFRQSLIMYGREAAPSQLVGGSDSNITKSGWENTATPWLTAVKASSIPQLNAFNGLYEQMKKDGEIKKDWDYEKLHRLVMFSAQAGAGLNPEAMPKNQQALSETAKKYSTQLLKITGPEGMKSWGVHLGLKNVGEQLPAFKTDLAAKADPSTTEQNWQKLRTLDQSGTLPETAKELLFERSSTPSLSPAFISGAKPQFTAEGGKVNMKFTIGGKEYQIKDYSSRFDQLFYPPLRENIPVKGDPIKVAERLNKAVDVSRAVIGGQFPE